jgi:hypothetical protein
MCTIEANSSNLITKHDVKYKITKAESSQQIFLLSLHIFFKEKYFIIADKVSPESKLQTLFLTLQE